MRSTKVLGLLVVFGVLTAACTGTDDPLGDNTEEDSSGDVVGDDNNATDTTDPAPSSADDDPTTTRVTQTVDGAWAEVWRVLLGLGPSGVVNTGLASDQAADDLGRLPLSDATQAEHYPRIEAVSGLPTTTGEMELTDCVLFDSRPPVWLTGTLTRSNQADDWVLDSIQVLDADGGCVPEEVATAAIAGAQAFWDADPLIWNPADPDHPLIAETTTGVYRSFLEDLLTDLENIQVRANLSGSEPNFGILRVDSLDHVLLVTCFEPDPDYGFFLPNGDHIEGSTPVRDGQTSIDELTMLREANGDEAVWKVEDRNGQFDVDCDPTSESSFLPVH